MITEVYIVVREYEYEGYDLPEECFLNYASALAKLEEWGKRLKLKVRKGNYIQLRGGTIEIHAVKILDGGIGGST